MNHFTIDFGTFSSTTVTFGATTDEGRAALARMAGGIAPISIEVRKSMAPEFLDRLIALLPEGAAAEGSDFSAHKSGLTAFAA